MQNIATQIAQGGNVAASYKPKTTAESPLTVIQTEVPIVKVMTSAKEGTVRIDTTATVKQYPPSFVAGSKPKGIYKSLNEKDHVDVGDIVKIKYQLNIPFFKDWQKDKLVSQLNSDPKYRLIYVEFTPEANEIVLIVEILQPGSLVLVVAIGIAALLVGISIFMSVSSVSKLVADTTTLSIGNTKIGLAPIVLIPLALLFIIPALRKLV